MRAALLFAPQSEGTLRACAAPYGLAGARPSEIFRAVAGYRLTEEASRVLTPLLIVDSELGALWPGQSRRLAELVGGPVQVRAGAGGADALDWLEPFLAR